MENYPLPQTGGNTHAHTHTHTHTHSLSLINHRHGVAFMYKCTNEISFLKKPY